MATLSGYKLRRCKECDCDCRGYVRWPWLWCYCSHGFDHSRALRDAKTRCCFGAKSETFMGMSGLGDLVLTCTDNQSRNRRYGLALRSRCRLCRSSKGDWPGCSRRALKCKGSVYALAGQLGVEMPIVEQVYAVLYQGLPARQGRQHSSELEEQKASLSKQECGLNEN